MRRVHREATERVGANRMGQNGMRGRVHREATKHVLFIGSQPAWTEQLMETRPGISLIFLQRISNFLLFHAIILFVLDV